MDGEVRTDAVRAALADDDESPLVVDIRNPAAYRRGHVPGSVNVPLGELAARVEAVLADRDSDPDRVVTVCPKGKSSRRAARIVAAELDDAPPVESMAGGLAEWDGDLERGTGPDGADGPDDADASESRTDEGPQAPF
ncbi:MAG: rhodanese-like domain-containing protein [Halolamina sp.]